MYYYATQSPRGFSNEVMIHRFGRRRERDGWVDEHRYDGDANSAYCGAKACTAREARAILRRRGDAVTQQYVALVEH